MTTTTTIAGVVVAVIVVMTRQSTSKHSEERRSFFIRGLLLRSLFRSGEFQLKAKNDACSHRWLRHVVPFGKQQLAGRESVDSDLRMRPADPSRFAHHKCHFTCRFPHHLVEGN